MFAGLSLGRGVQPVGKNLTIWKESRGLRDLLEIRKRLLGGTVPQDLTDRQLEKEERGQEDLQVWKVGKEEKNDGRGDLRCERIKFERGTVPQNSGEAMPTGKIRDMKHVSPKIVSGMSQYSLKSPAKGEGNIKNLILKGKTLRLLHFGSKWD